MIAKPRDTRGIEAAVAVAAAVLMCVIVVMLQREPDAVEITRPEQMRRDEIDRRLRQMEQEIESQRLRIGILENRDR